MLKKFHANVLNDNQKSAESVEVQNFHKILILWNVFVLKEAEINPKRS